ncbi:Condensin-2 complex subunit D3 [Glycine soja]
MTSLELIRACLSISLSHSLNRNPNGALQSCLMVMASFRNAAINVFRVINSKKATITAFTNPLHTLRFTPFSSHTQNQALEIDLSNEESKRHLFNQFFTLFDFYGEIFIFLTFFSYYIEANNEGSWNWIWSSENGLRPDNIHSLDEIQIKALVHVLDLVDAHLKALKTLFKRKASNLEEAEALVLKWVHQVLSRASGIIEKFISENSEQNAEGSFFTPPRSETSKGRESVAKSKSLSKAVIAIYTVGSVVIVCPSADMSNRDYVKWKGVLFLVFLLSLGDESEKIRQLADFLFGNILKVKSPLLAYNSFVEAVFVLNNYHVHNGHGESQGSQKESQIFSIR